MHHSKISLRAIILEDSRSFHRKAAHIRSLRGEAAASSMVPSGDCFTFVRNDRKALPDEKPNVVIASTGEVRGNLKNRD